MAFKFREVLKGISEVRPFDIIVMNIRGEDNRMGLIIEGGIFIIYYMLNRLAFKGLV